MNRKTLRKVLNYGFIGLFLGMLILFPTFQNNSLVNLDKNPVGDQINLEKEIPIGQDNYEVMNTPFFENVTPISDWMMNNIIDNSTVQANPDYPMFFGETNISGTEIIDYNHYFEDFAVMLDGLVNILGMDNSEIVEYFDIYQYSEFWDSNVTQNGYYTWINQDWTTNSTLKELNGNAQIILTFIDWLISEQSVETYGVESYISSQWDVLDNLFYDSAHNVYNLYNHSTDDHSKYSEDQFISAISGFLIHRANHGDLSSQIDTEEAFNIANNTMEYMISEDFLTSNSFGYKRSPDLSTSEGSSAFLGPNAYGILALLEWYVELGAPEDGDDYDKSLGNAEKVFHALNNTLWNSTYSLFMTEMDYIGSSVWDYKISLKDNSIMLSAMQKLFEITGNFTYYNVCLDIFNGMNDYLKDPIYGTYYNWLNATATTEIDKNKNLNAHAYLFRAISSLSALSEKVTTNITTNATDYIKGESSLVNVSVDYYFDYNNFIQPDEIINKIVPIEFADFFYSVYFPNGTVAHSSTENGNINGSSYIEFDLLDEFPLGEYIVDIYANYTGIETIFDSISFSLISGFKVDEYSLESESIRAGSSTNINITINSTRMENITVSINLNGTNIENKTFNQLLLCGTLNNFTFEVQTLPTASFGPTTFNVEIFNVTTLNYSIEIPITILSSIEVKRIQQDADIFHNNDFEVKIDLENMIELNQTVDISISGEFIVNTQVTQTIQSKSSISLTLKTQITNDAPYGPISYELNITRASDGSLISYGEYISIVKYPLEILFLDVPEASYHGKESQIICYIVNYFKSSQNISIFVNNESIYSYMSLIPGENLINIPIGNKFLNPYDFGDKFFMIEIMDANNNLIYEELVKTELKSSVESILFAYVLPIIIPVAGIVIIRHIALENKKRLG